MLQSVIKVPFRAARAAWRAARAVVGPSEPPVPPARSRPTAPTAAAPAAPAAPAPAAAPAPVAAATPPPAPVMPVPTGPVEVYVEETPNPHARKFLCSTTLLERGSLVFNSAEEASAHPVGHALFAIDGVRTVFITKDFVTVTCTPEARWRELQPAVWATLVGVLSS